MVFYEKDLSKLSRIIFVIFRTLRFIKVTEKLVDDSVDKKSGKKSGQICYESSNFTLINFYLTLIGPTKEDTLTFHLLIIQVILIFWSFFFNALIMFSWIIFIFNFKVLCCAMAFIIRYQISKLFY